jgi:KaiC/GvpD/RAD55 family RecA-like ATPase
MTPSAPGETSNQQKSDRASIDPTLWVSRIDDLIAAQDLSQLFRLVPTSCKPSEVAKTGERHIVINTDERITWAIALALESLGCQVDIFTETALSDLVFSAGINNAAIIILDVAKPFKNWQRELIDQAIDLENAIDVARVWMTNNRRKLEVNLALENLRKRADVSSFDWNRYIRQLEEEIHSAVDGKTDPDERLKLDLKALSKETDPIKRMRRRAEIASHYRLKIADIEQALKHLDERSKSKQPRRMGLDELFDLPQVGIEYVIPGMLPVGETVLLVASPKAGKSLLAYDAAFAIATGEDNFLGEQVKQGRVLIVQCDESMNTAKGRLIKRGFRHEDAANVQFVDSFKITQLDLLEEWLESFRPTLIIIDSVRRISAGRELSENSAEFADAIYQLKELIARYNTAAILIHHSSKNQEAVGVDRVRGSSAIAGAVWGVWQLDHILKPDPNNKKRKIIDPKDPTRILSIIARDVEGQRLKIELNPENNHWLALGEVGVEASEINERKTHEDQILELLKPIAPTGLEASEINAQLNIGRGVYNCLHRLLAKGIIGSRPSATDRRRTVYYYPTNNLGDTPPSLSPTLTDPVVIEYAETLTEQGLDNRSQIDHKFDHKSITKNTVEPLLEASKPEQVSISEVDHKNSSQGGECVSAKFVIDSSGRGDDALEVGEKVDWINCPGHCESWAPFEIISINNSHAKLDLFEKPVPLTELRRR